MNEIEIGSKTVEDALAIALAELGATRDQVEVTIVKKGRPGIFGVGAENARVHVKLAARPAARRPETQGETAPGDSTAVAAEVLSNLLRLMKVEATVEAVPATAVAPVTLNVDGGDLGVLIGRRGQTLASLQYIVRLIVAEKSRKWLPLVVDVSGYKEHRRMALQNLAMTMADQVSAGRRPATMEAMPADERRIVHLTLADHAEVTTQSIGEGDERKVVIQPKKR